MDRLVRAQRAKNAAFRQRVKRPNPSSPSRPVSAFPKLKDKEYEPADSETRTTFEKPPRDSRARCRWPVASPACHEHVAGKLETRASRLVQPDKSGARHRAGQRAASFS